MSMEMELFVTPEKQRQHPSVSVEKTPVRRKLIVDDDSEIGSVLIILLTHKVSGFFTWS